MNKQDRNWTVRATSQKGSVIEWRDLNEEAARYEFEVCRIDKRHSSAFSETDTSRIASAVLLQNSRVIESL